MTEELITDTLSRVGQVLSFRLVYDKDTGRPKGFGFAEFSDVDAAASAVRNLNDHELMGRKLRVDYSNDGGANDAMPANYNPQSANGLDPAQGSHASVLPPLPVGADLPPNLSCPDAISRTLSTLPAPQLLDILAQMKTLVTSDAGKATELLKQAPQLSYAIFQSLLLLGLVDTSILTSVVDQATAPQPVPIVPPALQVPTVQQTAFHQFAAPPYQMHVPTPPLHGQPFQPPPAAAAPQLPAAPTKDDLIKQVMGMSLQQIEQLGPELRAQLLALRHQFMQSRGQ